jgi:hypothetical protein
MEKVSYIRRPSKSIHQTWDLLDTYTSNVWRVFHLHKRIYIILMRFEHSLPCMGPYLKKFIAINTSTTYHTSYIYIFYFSILSNFHSRHNLHNYSNYKSQSISNITTSFKTLKLQIIYWFSYFYLSKFSNVTSFKINFKHSQHH